MKPRILPPFSSSYLKTITILADRVLALSSYGGWQALVCRCPSVGLVVIAEVLQARHSGQITCSVLRNECQTLCAEIFSVSEYPDQAYSQHPPEPVGGTSRDRPDTLDMGRDGRGDPGRCVHDPKGPCPAAALAMTVNELRRPKCPGAAPRRNSIAIPAWRNRFRPPLLPAPSPLIVVPEPIVRKRRRPGSER